MVRVIDVTRLLTFMIASLGAFSISPFAGNLFVAGMFAVMIFSYFLDKSDHAFLPRMVLNIIAVIVILLTFARMNIDNVVIPAMEALLVITSIKFLEHNKEYRDYMQIYLLSILMLAASGLENLGLSFAFHMTAMFIMVTVAVIFLTIASEKKDSALNRKDMYLIIRRTLLLPVLSVPLAIVIFLVLPRTSIPFFDFLNSNGVSQVGFTDTIRLGNVSSIQGDNRIIFRAAMRQIPQRHLYWRGIVLDKFDGKNWKASHKRGVPDYTEGEAVEQTILLEPYYDKYLFSLDAPSKIEIYRVRRTTDMVYYMRNSIRKRTQYEAYSILSEYYRDKRIDKDFYTKVPENIAEYMNMYAEDIAGDNTLETASNVMAYFQGNGFKYGLEGLPTGDNALKDFMTVNKTGNCEFYASAAAIILRLKGIPARLVGGYKGGIYNSRAGYYLVPQKNAHVWVEVYVEGKGWKRFDPTPASMDLFTTRGSSFRESVRMFFDTINYYWNASVIGYDAGQQYDIVNGVGLTLRNPIASIKSGLKSAGSFLLIAVALAVVFGFIRYFYVSIKYFDKRLIIKFEEILKKKGIERHNGEGLESLVKRIDDENVRENAEKFVKEFHKYYYGCTEKTGEEKSRLKNLLDYIK